jgi:hypothetical protein
MLRLTKIRTIALVMALYGSEAYAQPKPTFPCSPALNQVLSGQLNTLDADTLNYSPIGSTITSYNGIGYNKADGYIYGQQGSNVIQIDANGVARNLTLTSISGSTPSGSFIGDFDNFGNLLLSTNTNYWLLSNINPTALTADSRQLTKIGTGSVNDFAYVPSENAFFGVSSGGGQIVKVAYDPSPNQVTVTSISLFGASVSGAFGALWADSAGRETFTE